MTLGNKLAATWRVGLAGALLSAGVAAALLWLGGWPVILSYDLPMICRQTPPPAEAVIVYLDDVSFNEMGQVSAPNWDRALHARLLDRLTQDGAKVVVFDIVFSEPGTPEANARLAGAMEQNGKVVLAAALNYPSRAQIAVAQPLLPLSEFLKAAAGWGIAEIDFDESPGRIARRYYTGTATQPSLPRVAAKVAGLDPPAEEVRSRAWLNYYGPALTLPRVSYRDVNGAPPGYFRDKCVFVGAGAITLKPGDEADQFRTPHSLWNDTFTPGVEIGATAFLNLVRNEGLVRQSRGLELPLVLALAALVGGAISVLRPLAAIGLAIFSVVAWVIAALQAAGHGVWFAWSAAAFAAPVALAWSVRAHFYRLKFEKEVLERTLTSRDTAAAKTAAAGPAIPDHALVRCVGKGAYGEVWLARNAVGVFHAVKIVRRQEFPADEPYEREFRGIEKFMPISRSHAGFVHVLHVGRNNEAGFFFCIMEAADDRTLGQKIEPGTYVPRTLATELQSRGKLMPDDCLQLGLALAAALEHLHQQGLVHRDIKPGNIIFVNGLPKFADIGLVTEQSAGARNISFVGTEGYIPPEGPGAPSADVYALGKVLYETSTGRDRQLFPEVPTAVLEQPDDSLLRRLNQVIGKACETSVADRYQSAAELHAALAKLRG